MPVRRRLPSFNAGPRLTYGTRSQPYGAIRSGSFNDDPAIDVIGQLAAPLPEPEQEPLPDNAAEEDLSPYVSRPKDTLGVDDTDRYAQILEQPRANWDSSPAKPARDSVYGTLPGGSLSAPDEEAGVSSAEKEWNEAADSSSKWYNMLLATMFPQWGQVLSFRQSLKSAKLARAQEKLAKALGLKIGDLNARFQMGQDKAAADREEKIAARDRWLKNFDTEALLATKAASERANAFETLVGPQGQVTSWNPYSSTPPPAGYTLPSVSIAKTYASRPSPQPQSSDITTTTVIGRAEAEALWNRTHNVKDLLKKFEDEFMEKNAASPPDKPAVANPVAAAAQKLEAIRRREVAQIMEESRKNPQVTYRTRTPSGQSAPTTQDEEVLALDSFK